MSDPAAGPKPEEMTTVEPPQTAEKSVIIKDPTQPLYLEGYHRPDYRAIGGGEAAQHDRLALLRSLLQHRPVEWRLDLHLVDRFRKLVDHRLLIVDRGLEGVEPLPGHLVSRLGLLRFLFRHLALRP